MLCCAPAGQAGHTGALLRAGLLSRSGTALFEGLAALPGRATVWLQAFAIYQERLCDLLGGTDDEMGQLQRLRMGTQAPQRRMRQRPVPAGAPPRPAVTARGRQLYVERGGEVEVGSAAGLDTHVDAALQRLYVHHTGMGQRRSYTALVFLVRIRRAWDAAVPTDGGPVPMASHCQMSWTVLPQSDREAKVPTGQALREGALGGVNLNTRGMRSFGNVLTALAPAGVNKARHIPYRDSVLTRLLQNDLGGNCESACAASASGTAHAPPSPQATARCCCVRHRARGSSRRHSVRCGMVTAGAASP